MSFAYLPCKCVAVLRCADVYHDKIKRYTFNGFSVVSGGTALGFPASDSILQKLYLLTQTATVQCESTYGNMPGLASFNEALSINIDSNSLCCLANHLAFPLHLSFHQMGNIACSLEPVYQLLFLLA